MLQTGWKESRTSKENMEFTSLEQAICLIGKENEEEEEVSRNGSFL